MSAPELAELIRSRLGALLMLKASEVARMRPGRSFRGPSESIRQSSHRQVQDRGLSRLGKLPHSQKRSSSSMFPPCQNERKIFMPATLDLSRTRTSWSSGAVRAPSRLDAWLCE